MNGKKAKALRRLNAALEQERLAFQEMIRRGTPVPVKTMSMDEFNKARVAVIEEGAEATKVADAGGIGVIATTPRTPDVDPDALAAEMAQAAAIEQEVKVGLIQQNCRHYVHSDEITLTREDAFKQMSPELLLESRRATKALIKTGLTDGLEPGAASAANKRCSEVLDRQHQSINGPEAYAKLGSMGSKV